MNILYSGRGDLFKDSITMCPLEGNYINLGFIIFKKIKLTNKSIKCIIHKKVQK